MGNQIRVSFVLPIYNEQQGLASLFAEFERLCTALYYEIVLIDDGSTDQSWKLIVEQSARDGHVRGIRLSRNFGHQIALSAGLDAARGDAVITMDADLQDPIETALEMITKWNEGYDIVYAVRSKRLGESWFKRATAYVYYRLLRCAAESPAPTDVGDFRLLSRRAVEALRNCPERSPYLRGLVAWIGFPHANVVYERRERRDGKTKFSIFRMLRFATTGLVSSSSLPLILPYYFGAASLLGGASVLCWATYSMGKGNEFIIAGILLTLAVVFVMLGNLGIYVARIYDEIRARPQYFVSARTDPPATTSHEGTATSAMYVDH